MLDDSDQPPDTIREVTLEHVMVKLEQMERVILAMSGAVVELNKTVKRHLDSHDHDARRLSLVDDKPEHAAQ